MTATLISIGSWDANRRADLGVENRFLPAANPGSVRRAAHQSYAGDSRVELLRAASAVPFRLAGGALEFTIPRVADYEVAAVYSS